MAKTDFQNGTIVTPEFLDSIYLTDGGHKHDGDSDEDGHAPKISLTSAAEVSGLLPRANQIPPRGYIDGFGLTYVQSTDAWNLQFSAGHCCMGNAAAPGASDSTATKYVINDAGTGFVTWAQGNNAGGVADGVSGPSDNQWLHCFVIRKSSDGSIDFGLDSSVTAANLCDATWNQYRRVGSIQIVSLGGGKYGIREFKQRGDRFLWETFVSDWNSDDFGGHPTVTAVPLTVPSGIEVVGLLSLIGFNTSGGLVVYLWDGPLGNDWNPHNGVLLSTISSGHMQSTDAQIGTDESQQIYGYSFSGNDKATIRCRGWLDPRGKQ